MGLLQYLSDILKPLFLKLLDYLLPIFVMPDWAQSILDCVAEICYFPCVTLLLNIVVWIVLKLLWLYVIWFPTHEVTRWAIKYWDSKDYESLTVRNPPSTGPQTTTLQRKKMTMKRSYTSNSREN